MDPRQEPTSAQNDSEVTTDNSTNEELREIAGQTEQESTVPEVIAKGDAYLESQRGAAETMIHHLVHLPARHTEYGGNSTERLKNAALKTIGVVLGAFALKIGISSDQVPVMAETVLAGGSVVALTSSILHGMIADRETRDIRRNATGARQIDGQSAS